MSETQSTKDGGTVYEIGFHIAPIVSDEQVVYEVSEIKNLLEKIKAVTVSEDFPRLRVLAYPLSKVIEGSKKAFNEAYFGWIKFEASPEDIASFSKEVEKLPKILRFIVIKTVRENTLQGNKFNSRPEGRVRKEIGKRDETLPKQEVNEVEVDKAIEELVVE